jgi:hypothetical protein
MVVGVDEVDLFPTVIVLVVVVPVLDFVCVELSSAGNGRLASVLVWLSEVGLFAMESVELEELDVKVNDANDANEVDVQKSIVLSGLSLVVVAVAETWTLRLSGNVPMYIVLAVLSVLVDIEEVVELTVSCLAEVYRMPVVNSCNECLEVVDVEAVEVLVPVLVAVTVELPLVDASLQLPMKKGSALDGMMLPM